QVLMRYIEDIRQGSADRSDVRIVMVGDGGAGKTTLKNMVLLEGVGCLSADIAGWALDDLREWLRQRDLPALIAECDTRWLRDRSLVTRDLFRELKARGASDRIATLAEFEANALPLDARAARDSGRAPRRPRAAARPDGARPRARRRRRRPEVGVRVH